MNSKAILKFRFAGSMLARFVGILYFTSIFSGCGAQIASLRLSALEAGITGVPPILDSIQITNLSPTNQTPLTLLPGIVIGKYDEYCILENSTDSQTCIWHAGPLATTYSDTAGDGPCVVSVFLKNNFGTSVVVSSNSVVIDRTAATLAAVNIGNANPTNLTNFSLTYGAVTNAPYATYCILENDTTVAHCAWITGALPASYAVSAISGSKTLSVWIADAAGNVSPLAQSAAVTYDGTVPTVAITAPGAGSAVNIANEGSLAVSGTCSVNGQNVTISGAATATAVCMGGAWATTVDLSASPEGSLTLTAHLVNTAGTAAIPASVNVTKDSVAPTLAITSPAAGSFINIASVASVTVSGSCSENGRNVVVSGSASATVVCGAGVWAANLNFTGAADGAVSITANHSDAAGNPATPANRSFTKDTVAPTVAITSPAAGTYVNSAGAAAFTVSGTCSENGRTINLSGAATGTATCTTGTWTTSLNVSASADGTITVNANLSDAAGNPATLSTRSFTKDTAAPTIAITSPAAASYVNIASAAAFTVSGTCSENGQPVTLGGAGSGTTSCVTGAWSKTLNVSAAGDGPISVTADITDLAGNPALQASRSFTKDTVAPTVAITAPAAASYVTSANATTFALSGTCSENTRNVTISGAGSATVACAGGTWSKSVDVSGAADGTITLTFDHTDAAGNPAVQASRTFTKDTTVPTVAFTSPAAGTNVDATNEAAFTISGTCTAVGQTVALTGLGAATPTCAGGGTWTVTFDLTATIPGSITLVANHSNAAGTAAIATNRSFTKVAVTACPTNFVRVEKNTFYVNNPFCVSKYDMKNVSGVAVSQAAAVPWLNISRAASIAACSALGGRYSLTSNNQWQTMARDIESVGWNWNGGVVGNTSGLSRGNANGTPNTPIAADPSDVNACLGVPGACSDTVWNTVRRTFKFSNGSVVWDLSGNASKWIAEDVTVATGAFSWTSVLTAGAQKDTFGTATDYSAVAWVGTVYGNMGYQYAANAATAITRGGYFGQGRYAGVFAVESKGAATGGYAQTTFRCMYRLDQ
jgi:hypothetical protein